jgi:hypothetical protein
LELRLAAIVSQVMSYQNASATVFALLWKVVLGLVKLQLSSTRQSALCSVLSNDITRLVATSVNLAVVVQQAYHVANVAFFFV